jgi:hypothetical protein
VVNSDSQEAPSHDGGSICIMLAMGSLLALCEIERATRGKWRILGGKGENGLFDIRSFDGDSSRLCQLKTASVRPCCIKH